jgi:hypothetical protein
MRLYPTFAVVALLSLPYNHEDSPKMIPAYYISVKSQNVISRVGINDVPLVVDNEAEGILTSEPVNYWIQPSGNRLTISLQWPQDRELVRGQARVQAEVFLADPQAEIPKPGEVIARFSWPDPEIEESYPYTHSIELKGMTPPPTKFWVAAEKLATLKEEDKSEILSLVEAFRDELLAKRSDAAFAYLEYRYADEALAEGQDPGELREAVTEQYAWMMQMDGELESDRLEYDKSRFSIVANGLIVHVVREDGRPAVVLSNEDQDLEFEIPIFVGKIRGKWTIAR